MAPLQPGATLHQRIRDLQPFHRHDVLAHPLRVLVEHTNWSKHRTPSVAATLLGTVVPDEPAEDIVLPAVPDRPIEVGDVLASVPAKRQVGLSIWPQISIQRPHTESWHNLLHELRDLERWVREVAIPILVAGISDVPVLPPHLDTTVGYADLRAALAAADPTPAAARTENDLQAGVARESLPGIIMLHPEAGQHATAISRWIAELGADEVRQKFDSPCVADPQQRMAAIRAMIVDARTAPGER